MKKFIISVLTFVLLLTSNYITVDAKPSVKQVTSTCIGGTPEYDDRITYVSLGKTKVNLKRDFYTTCWVRFKAPKDAMYEFTFSDVKQNLESTLNKPAIICFYDKGYRRQNVLGLGMTTNGFVISYDRGSASRLKEPHNSRSVNLVLSSGDVINICCDNILTYGNGEHGTKASYMLEIKNIKDY